MITASFEKKNNLLFSVCVSGHANFADYGSDIVCSAVTSALELCANGITHILKVSADIVVTENNVTITLPHDSNENAVNFLKAFLLHLENLKEDYPNNIKIISTEV